MSNSTVRIDKLSDDNYATWKPKMMFMLIVNGCWSSVNPRVEEDETKSGAETRSSSGKALADQSEGSAKALAIIGLNVSDHLVPEVAEASSARELWQQFERTFQAKTKARSLLLKKQLHNLKLQPKESVNMYLARARSIMTDLKSISSTTDESEVALDVLAGLPAEFGVAVEVLQYAEDLSFEIMLPKLLHAEQLAKEKVEKEVTVSIYGAQAHSGKYCFYCKKPGHVKAQCRMRQAAQQEPECIYCHKKGHWKSDCQTRISDERVKSRGFPGQKVAF